MRDAVIVDAVRTPVGKRDGALSRMHAVAVSAHVLGAWPSAPDWTRAWSTTSSGGCVGTLGMQAGCIARSAVLAAGWPEHVPGVTVDRQCGSSQQAVHQAAAGVISGQYDIAVAGGVEMMSVIPPLGAAARAGDYGPIYGPGAGPVQHRPVRPGPRRPDDRRRIRDHPHRDGPARPRLARPRRCRDRRRPVHRTDRPPIEVAGPGDSTRIFDTDEASAAGAPSRNSPRCRHPLPKAGTSPRATRRRSPTDRPPCWSPPATSPAHTGGALWPGYIPRSSPVPTR